ncbi:MAG: STAS domain-containing protein [Candidatus Methanomethylophilaceae archaeon]|nr:STAS domain-containing protein [Candidatus Methanomethylophilaceae archaeon]
MEIGIEKKDGVTTISPKGNIDYVTAPELDEVVERESADAASLVFDMSCVSYISSAGLRSLLNADELMEEKNGIKLINVNKEVKAVLDMTNFSGLLRIERAGSGS